MDHALRRHVFLKGFIFTEPSESSCTPLVRVRVAICTARPTMLTATDFTYKAVLTAGLCGDWLHKLG